MRTGLFAVLSCCCAVFAWAWASGSGATGSEVGALAQAAGPTPGTVQAIAVQEARVAAPLLPEPAAAVPVGPPVLESALWTAPRVPSAEAERIARRYFHTQVLVEDLERLLPSDLEANPRTRERFPGYFAAIDERDDFGLRLSQLPPPAPIEALPALDLSAAGSDFERIYGAWSREDLLVENWRISRFAYAESKRLLEEQFMLGPYRADPGLPLGAFS